MQHDAACSSAGVLILVLHATERNDGDVSEGLNGEGQTLVVLHVVLTVWWCTPVGSTVSSTVRGPSDASAT
jgi:hypothetical protein